MPKKKKKGLLIGIAAVVVVVIIGVGAYFGITEMNRSNLYNEATTLMQNGSYEAAKTKFSELEDYKDSADQVSKCDKYIAYNKADELFKAGSYYDAYKAFNTLGTFNDSTTRAKACIQPVPGTGEIYRNEAFAAQTCPVTINSPASNTPCYMKVYSGDTLVSTLVINPGTSMTLSLPVGSYQVKSAYGSNWYGEKDMFGDSGTYKIMVFNDAGGDVMQLEPNYTYTLDLKVSTSGNVGSKSTNRSTF